MASGEPVRDASETDFVLATAFSQRVKLLKVANGYVCPVSHAWIGSKQAYVRYEAYHDGRRTPLLRNSVSGLHLEVFGSDHSQGGDKAYARMRRAFRETLNSADLQEIAGFVISATYVTGSYHHFSYMPCSEIITCPSHFAVGDIVFTNRDPSTSYFDFRIELMVARWPARPAVAIFFPDGECGYIYVASNHDRMPRRCTINNVENIEKFVLVSREAYGVFLPEVERVGVCDLLSGVAGGKKVFHTITPTGMGN
jgi:hypothetical protein